MDIAALEIAQKILSENCLCSLATVSPDSKPEVATMEFAEDGNFILYFETFPDYRKYVNLKKNPSASVVVTLGGKTLQMDGTMEELVGDDILIGRQKLVAKQGGAKEFYAHPNIRFFRFTASWVRVMVKGGFPPEFVVLKG